MLTKTAKLEAFVAVPELKFDFVLQFLIILSKGRSLGQGRFHRGLLQMWRTSLQSTVTSRFKISHQKVIYIYIYFPPTYVHPASSKNQSKRAIFLSQVAFHLLTSKYAKPSAKHEQ